MSERADDKGNAKTAVADSEDRISALPDDVLRHVLSFLPSRNSVRTCVLAKRWCTLWKSVPDLRIKDDPQSWRGCEDPSESEGDSEDDDGLPDTSIFADELLRHRDPTPLNVCEIFSSYVDANYKFNDDDDEDINISIRCDYMEAFRRIEPWIEYALSHEVRVLRVDAASSTTNQFLVSSHLQRVELTWMQFECTLDFSSCPVLDVLELSSCTIYGNILSQSLRHLNIQDGSFNYDIRCRISAPNLISLKLDQDTGLPPLLDSMPLLVTASIGESVEYKQQNGEESFSVVFEGVSSATNLELITPYYQNSVFKMDLKWCPMFSKLKTLLLNEWCMASNFTGLVYFLQHSPILEMLTLQLDIPKYEEYHLIKIIESCNSREQGYNSRDQSLLSNHLKVVKIICGKKEDVKVQHILKILCTHGVPSEQIDIQ
uniref:Uncharacterized protein n=1 Tax=Avena sativa TaxID=4498 RepID=A0ACD5Z4Y1_AVESA